MSTIQNLKNFIRHGKQARASPPHGDPTTNISPVHAQQQRYNGHQAPPPNNYAISDPILQGGHKPLQGAHVPGGDYSVANMDNRNVAAQAGGAAAKAVADHQRMGDGGTTERKKDYDPSAIERIVAEERESKGKLPKYPGLERWTLLEKMGDGAFSNVYRAKDTTGQLGEVAIKVVRKFEMNSNQVSMDCFADRPISATVYHGLCFYFPPKATSLRRRSLRIVFEKSDQPSVVIGRQSSSSGFQEATKDRGGAHNLPYKTSISRIYGACSVTFSLSFCCCRWSLT